MTDNRRIVCAAIKGPDGEIHLGPHHYSTLMMNSIQRHVPRDEVRYYIHRAEQGFIDNHEIFLNRQDALDVAIAAGQVHSKQNGPRHLLFSELLY